MCSEMSSPVPFTRESSTGAVVVVVMVVVGGDGVVVGVVGVVAVRGVAANVVVNVAIVVVTVVVVVVLDVAAAAADVVDVLTVVGGDTENFEYRIVNDTGDRVAMFQSHGYEIVSDDKIQVGDRRISNPTKEGSPVRVSVGGGTQAYLMRQKKEFYQEDQSTKQVQ